MIPLLSVEVREESGTALLILRGELDDASIGKANKALGDALGREVEQLTIDLKRLDFMDSTGVKFLIDARNSARGLGIKIAISYGEGLVERVLAVSGVAALFEREDDA